MSSQTKIETNPFSGKVRVRACGILFKEDEILLIKHNSIGPAGYLWCPPGGGVDFGVSLQRTIENEFLEETNLIVEVGTYLFANEYIDSVHHAVEMFFSVKYISGELKLGLDPEIPLENQILSEARFFNYNEIKQIPKNAIHNAFHAVETQDKITDLRGLITFKH